MITLMCCNEEMYAHGFWPHSIKGVFYQRFECKTCKTEAKVLIEQEADLDKFGDRLKAEVEGFLRTG